MASQSLPPINCFSGKYTIRLAVEDTAAGIYYDLQHIWIDNKAIYGKITSLLGVPACSVLNLSQLPNAGDCSKVWPLGIEGIAYDEYIIEGDFSIPSDNYGGYCLTLTKQGGSNSDCTSLALSVALPVPGPLSPTTVGTNRVGDPGVRCASASPPPAGPIVGFSNLLTQMDGRMFDADCAAKAMPAPPAGFALKRADPATGQPGECCSFYFMLEVWDNSICPSLSGGHHSAGPHLQRPSAKIMNLEEQHVWFRFVVAVLATWRVTHLLAREDGPADLIYHSRRLLGRGLPGKLADCFQCLSIWIAAPFCLFATTGALERVVTWLALSGAACLAERLHEQGGPSPVMIQNLENQEESENALLWTESSEFTSKPDGNREAVSGNGGGARNASTRDE